MQGDELLSLLINTANPNLRVAAEARLGECEKQAGFVLGLLAVCSNAQIAEPLRLGAVIYAKHALSRNVPAPGQEREVVKARLLEMVVESLPTSLLTQVSLIIANVARADWPQQWEKLFPWLTEAVSAQHVSLRALHVLRDVLESLSTLRLPAACAQFAAVSCQLLKFLLPGFASLCAEIVQQKGEPKDPRYARLLLKCVCLLIVRGFAALGEAQNSVLVLLDCFSKLAPLAARDELAKALRTRIGRCALALLRSHGGPFTPFVSPFGQALLPALSGGDSKELTIVALLFLHELVNNELGAQMPWLTAEFVSQLHDVMVTRHLLLTPDDLTQWAEEPEVFALEESHNRDEDSVRAASLQLFWSLLKHRPTLIAGPLLAQLQQVMKPVPPNERVDVGSPAYIYLLRKEAVYAAVGLATEQELTLDFPQWYPSLCAELRSCPIAFIRRRVVLLLQEWAGSTPETERLQLLALFGLVARGDKDILVRLAAVQAIRALVTVHIPLDQKQQATALLPQLVEALLLLLRDLQETEAKTGVVYVLRLVVKCFESAAVCTIPVFVAQFPATWESCKLDVPAQVDLMTMLSALVAAVGAQSPFPFLFAIIRYCLEPGAKDRGHLERPALTLWLGALKVAGAFTPEMLSLFAALWTYGMANSQETDLLLDLAEAHVLLGKGEFVSSQLATVSKGLLIVWQNNIGLKVPREAMFLQRVCGVCNILLQLFPQEFLRSPLHEAVMSGVCQFMATNFQKFPEDTLTGREFAQEFGVSRSVLAVFLPFIARATLLRVEDLVTHLRRTSLLSPVWDRWIKWAQDPSKPASVQSRILFVLAATSCLASPSSGLPVSSAVPALVKSTLAVTDVLEPIKDLDLKQKSEMIDLTYPYRVHKNLASFVLGVLRQSPQLAREVNPNMLEALTQQR